MHVCCIVLEDLRKTHQFMMFANTSILCNSPPPNENTPLEQILHGRIVLEVSSGWASNAVMSPLGSASAIWLAEVQVDLGRQTEAKKADRILVALPLLIPPPFLPQHTSTPCTNCHPVLLTPASHADSLWLLQRVLVCGSLCLRRQPGLRNDILPFAVTHAALSELSF